MDEAGRGAVLGPLIVAGAALPQEKEALLWQYGARDSKKLSRGKRRQILRSFREIGLRGRVVVIPPSAIDQASLTALELEAMASLIRFFQPTRVVLDPPVGPRALPHFLSALSRASGLTEEAFLAFPKADEKNAVVAAASILAKVVRDTHILLLHRKFGDFGWGYPGEPKVRDFLRDFVLQNNELPGICRKRWRSLRFLAQPKLQDRL